MNDFWGAAGAIILAIIGLATVAVVLGQRSKTTDVLTAGGNALSSLINAALSPVNSTAAGLTGQ